MWTSPCPSQHLILFDKCTQLGYILAGVTTMKWKIAAAVLVVCAVGVCVWAARPEKPEPVFRGMCWGDSPEKLGSRRLLRMERPPISVYMKIGDPLRMGDLELYSILYCFRNEKLFAIEVIAKDYEALASAVAFKYANAKYIKEDGDATWYHGIGKTTTACIVEPYTGCGGKGRMLLMDTVTTLDQFVEEYIERIIERANSW